MPSPRAVHSAHDWSATPHCSSPPPLVIESPKARTPRRRSIANSYHQTVMPDLTRTAIGTWSGGRFMRFGEPLDDDRMLALLRPDERIRTVMTADAYGAGEADTLLGRALDGVVREDYCLVGAVGHDFYEGEREGAKGFPRFTDPRLRGPDGYADYVRMATERSLERCGAEAFDLLLLHNPDRSGYTSG